MRDGGVPSNNTQKGEGEGGRDNGDILGNILFYEV